MSELFIERPLVERLFAQLTQHGLLRAKNGYTHALSGFAEGIPVRSVHDGSGRAHAPCELFTPEGDRLLLTFYVVPRRAGLDPQRPGNVFIRHEYLRLELRYDAGKEAHMVSQSTFSHDVAVDTQLLWGMCDAMEKLLLEIGNMLTAEVRPVARA